MSYRLWARGAAQQRRHLRTNGERRGISIGPSGQSEEKAVDGARRSAFIPSSWNDCLFVFEWDDHTNVGYVVPD